MGLIKNFDKKAAQAKRHSRLRLKISGTAEAPRLCINITLHHIYAQVIDDEKGVTLAAASTLTMKDLESTTNMEAAKKVGTRIAEVAKDKGITAVVFDRNGRRYQGRVAALADAAREAGLEF